jgi:hypothetical protein
MLEERNIIFFQPFYFPDGGSAPKDKFFIVLKDIGDETLLASLPTSKFQLPNTIDVTHGCISDEELRICTYCFKANKIISEDESWSFQKDTFLQGFRLKEYEKGLLTSIYKFEGVDFEILGKLSQAEYDNIVACFRNSKTVKRAYRRLFGANI